MRPLSQVTVAILLAVSGAFVAAADEPEPLVKPVTPGGNSVRVRLPMLGKTATSVYKAQIPKPKGKMGETAEIRLVVSSLTGGGTRTTIQQWKAWGFEVPENRMAELPDLIIPGAQVAPNPVKGRDIEYRLTKLKVSLYEAPGGETGGISNTLTIPLSFLTGGADRACEPRFHFADRFLELTTPPAGLAIAPGVAIKKLDTGEKTSPAPQLTNDDKLKAVYLPMTATRVKFVSVNEQTTYTRPTGKVEAVAGALEISGGAITMSISMARGCGVLLDKDAMPTTGTVKELRFGSLAGPGVKGQKDFVLKDVKVAISNNEDASLIWFGPAFVTEYFKDGVFACGTDGEWRLYGRVKPEYFDDQKNRAPAKKP